MSGINNLMIGAYNVDAFMIGSQQVETIYLGSEIVYQAGEFAGLIMNVNAELGEDSGATTTIIVKSSEPWTLSIDSSVTWLSASTLSGTSGETIVTLEATEDSHNDRSTTITATTANYSATCVVTQIYVDYVDYIHKTNIENEGFWTIDTGIKPTTTTSFRVKGMAKGLANSSYCVGFWTGSDSTDYRFFWTRNNIAMFDINNKRLMKSNFSIADGTLIDVTCDNYSMYNNITSSLIASGSPESSISDTASTISFNVGGWWFHSLEIWDGATKMFDGKAAIVGNTVGVFDSISNRLFTNASGDTAYETFYLSWYSESEGDITQSPYEMGTSETVTATIPLDANIGIVADKELVCRAYDVDNTFYYYIYVDKNCNVYVYSQSDLQNPLATLSNGNSTVINNLTITNQLLSSLKRINFVTNGAMWDLKQLLM